MDEDHRLHQLQIQNIYKNSVCCECVHSFCHYFLNDLAQQCTQHFRSTRYYEQSKGELKDTADCIGQVQAHTIFSKGLGHPPIWCLQWALGTRRH